MGRGGQDPGNTVSPQALLYGSAGRRIFRDRYLDSPKTGFRAKRRAKKLFGTYLQGDLGAFCLELKYSRSDPDRLPDQTTPLVLDLYRSIIERESDLYAGRLGIGSLPGEEREQLNDYLLPLLHQRILDLGEEALDNLDGSFGQTMFRRLHFEDAAFFVPGKLSRHRLERLATSDTPVGIPQRILRAILEGQTIPEAQAALDEALRRRVVLEANTPAVGPALPGDNFERSPISGYARADAAVHLIDGNQTVCGISEQIRPAKRGSWRDVNRPGSTWDSCPVCRAHASDRMLAQAEAERSDTSPRLKGHPALRGKSVDQFIDEIVQSDGVQGALREIATPAPEMNQVAISQATGTIVRSDSMYREEVLSGAIRPQLVGIEPLEAD
jgi:hypothetical protein